MQHRSCYASGVLVPFYDETRVKGTYLDLLPSELMVAVDYSVRHHDIVQEYEMPDGTHDVVSADEARAPLLYTNPMAMQALPPG
jgi:hypothetical protein